MTSTDLIALLTALISVSALIIATLSYRRDRNKSNQDFLFQEKVLIYKELIYHVNHIFESFYNLVEDLQDYEGSIKKWEKYLGKESESYDDLVTELQNCIFKALPMIPSEIYKELIKFGQESTHFITSAFNKNELLTIEAHDKLEISLRNVIDLVRKDLNVDKLNVALSNRLK